MALEAKQSEVKQEEEESDEEIEFCWNIFGLDLCEIVNKDLLYLFNFTNDENQSNADDSIYIDEKEQENMEKRKQMKENGKMLISNKYGRMFILYPKYQLLISFDSIEISKYLNDIYGKEYNISDRGISPPTNIYRVFTNIKV